MKLSRRCEYAIKALVELSINREKGREVTLISDIAQRENIPQRYLEHILLSLKKAGILESKRGVGGGYTLIKSQKDISLGEIVSIIDGSLGGESIDTKKTQGSRASAVSKCLRNIVNDACEIISNKLNSISLKEITEQTIATMKETTEAFMYVI